MATRKRSVPNMSPPEEEAGFMNMGSEPVTYGPWHIYTEEFTPFEDGMGKGVSINTVCADNLHLTDYSVSMYYGLTLEGEIFDKTETEDELKERLRTTVVDEMNDPHRADLISHRFR